MLKKYLHNGLIRTTGGETVGIQTQHRYSWKCNFFTLFYICLFICDSMTINSTTSWQRKRQKSIVIIIISLLSISRSRPHRHSPTQLIQILYSYLMGYLSLDPPIQEQEPVNLIYLHILHKTFILLSTHFPVHNRRRLIWQRLGLSIGYRLSLHCSIETTRGREHGHQVSE